MSNEIPTRRREQVHARDKGHCVRCGVRPIAGHAHHRRGRRTALGHDQHCVCNLIWLCGDCHRNVHVVDQVGARRDGFVVSRYETHPASVPVRYWNGEQVHFTCEGEMEFVVAMNESEET